MSEGIPPFAIGRLPRIVFGSGSRAAIGQEARAFGTKALAVTRRWTGADAVWREIAERLAKEGLRVDQIGRASCRERV
jgi:alcohol dehydrogenase class IV